MIRRPPRSTLDRSSAASDVYKRQRHIEDDQRVLVFDFGGGTLDVTILRSVEGVFVEEASKGVGRLGGIDIDRAFAETVKRRVPARSSIDASDLERAKVMLSTQETVTVSYTHLRAHETVLDLVCRLLLEKKKN